MKAAIYSRKSKFTGKGESVENQIQLCKEYAKHLNVTEFLIYEDEGFSGKNTERPEFQRMLNDAKKKKFDMLICYRLDRISRNIADFSTLIEDIQKFNIEFVSIREQFDTSTPMGRAMMYIASVFAQLERETIAERVKDNMMELAKTGRWLGGQLPYGFTVNRIIEDGKEVSYLVPDGKIEKVKLIFDTYLEEGSIYKVLKKLLFEYNEKWTLSGIKFLLAAPYYVKSSPEVINYWESLGITVIGNADGSGFLSYNKRPGSSTKLSTPSSEWIYSSGRHEGIIEAGTWLKVQRLLDANKKKPRASASKHSYLTSLLRCSTCGGSMTVKLNNRSGNLFYICDSKNKFGVNACNNPNVKAEKLENAVIDYLEMISINQSVLEEEVAATKSDDLKSIKKDIDKTKKAIVKNESAIGNLVMQLSVFSPEAAVFVQQQLEKLSKDNAILKQNLLELEALDISNKVNELNNTIVYENIKNFKKALSMCETIEDKRRLFKSIIEYIIWDGFKEEIKVKILH